MQWTAAAIRALRKAYRDTQDQFADRIGVNRMTVKFWEVGRFAPAAANSEQLARLLATLSDRTRELEAEVRKELDAVPLQVGAQ